MTDQDPRWDNHDPCPNCAGSGQVIVPSHGCHGDVSACKVICPVPEDEDCPGCDGTGMVEIQDQGDPFS